MRYLKALAATTVLAGLMFGVPVGLVFGYGDPVSGLTEGLVTDTTITDVLVLIAWVVWVQMNVCFTIEAINQVRGLRGNRSTIALPAIGPQADFARVLIGAVLAVGVIGSSASIGASRAAAATAAPSLAATSQPAASVIKARPAARGRTREVIVQPGDSLWKLAEVHLGDGAQWRAIADLNHGRRMGGGVIATTAILQDGLQPGWKLLIPENQAGGGHHIVEPGESLSEIAQEATGSAANWPTVYANNRAVIGDDANLIYPGEDLILPASEGSRIGAGTERAHGEHSSTAPSGAIPNRQDVGVGSDHNGSSSQNLQAPPDGSHLSPSANDLQAVAPWLVGSLLLAGGVLAGHLYLRLRERRRDRSRARRPGRIVAAPDLEFAPMEKTITVVGSAMAASLESLDLDLRRLGQTSAQTGSILPRLAAIELTDTDAILHLAEPVLLPPPWVERGADQLRWQTRVRTQPDASDAAQMPAPYPLLASIGRDEHEHWWLLNLEEHGAVSVTGDTDRAESLIRYIAAELAIAHWARDTRIDLIGIGSELDGVDPRLHVHNSVDTPDVTPEALSHALAMIDRSRAAGTDAVTGRAQQPDDEIWPAHLIVSAPQAATREHLATVIELINSHPGRTATAVVTTGEAIGDRGISIEIASDGTLRIAKVGLTLTAAQLPEADAAGVTDLYRRARDLVETEVPVDSQAAEEWSTYLDAAGNLRHEQTIDRSTPTVGIETNTLLVGRDEDYLDRAAVVEEDLEILAPQVPNATSKAIHNADPHLENDLADWIHRSSRRPRLRLLGAVKSVGYGENLVEVSERVGFYTELLAFLWTRSHQGATTEEILSAFPTLSAGRVRSDIKTLRGWLGNNASTGQPLVPAANQAPARVHHHKNVYQVDCGPGGLIVDVDLLRRVRARAQAIGGSAGIALITTALVELVDGQPFSGLRRGGWSWLLDEGDRIDEHMVVAISDMAHIATSHYLAVDDVANARVTADIGLLAAPYEETMRLDLVAVKEAEGNREEATTLLDTSILNRSDDGLPPLDLSERTRRILKNHGWDQAG